MSALRWDAGWRETSWAQLDGDWDMVVIGGGITGAGVLRAAVRSGLRALLLERADFAQGASSRSTQLVHGGLRYLAQGHLRVTRDAVHSRDCLLREAPGLVTPLPFLLPLRAGRPRESVTNAAVLTLYEALAGRAGRLRMSTGEALMLAPALNRKDLRGGLRYLEARTDDARLVMRVLREAVAMGALALNAVAVTDVVFTRGRVCGVRVVDRPTGHTGEVRADVIVNATGAWADDLRGQVGGSPRMRPVGGSHLVFPGWRFPLAPGVNVRSPRDGRYVSVFPWEGATVVGTTDVEVGRLVEEPSITADEVSYLLECVCAAFPTLELTEADVLSTWSGVRPIVSSGARSSADELREHVVGDESGLLTVTGGKLTTFEVAARQVLRAAAPHLQQRRLPRPTTAPQPPGAPPPASDDTGLRLNGRHGREAGDLLSDARPDERSRIPGTPTTWAEVRWSARNEALTSISDLMLRRTRLGLLLPGGGESVLDSVMEICREELGWDAVRADQERRRYLAEMSRTHSIPPRTGTNALNTTRTDSSVTGEGPSRSPSA